MKETKEIYDVRYTISYSVPKIHNTLEGTIKASIEMATEKRI